MIERRTVVDQIEIRTSGPTRGVIHVRFGLLLLEDGAEIAPAAWHRVAIEPGGNIDAHMSAVNANFREGVKPAQGQKVVWPDIPSDGVALIKAHAAISWTDEVIAEWEARRLAALQAAAQS